MVVNMAQPPNVLLICVDHWPGSLLGIVGHPDVKTPTLDALARAGVLFTQAYSACPVCVPARRTLMTGTSPRTHGDRIFDTLKPFPALPSLAQCFRDAGYQAFASGKMHVFPTRNRIGFDDVILCEEGRVQFGMDDYDAFLGERGLAGQHFGHAMCNNEYLYRPWHLPEECHMTSFITRQMVKLIRRRDPTRPAFWYLSYTHPHPPLVPLREYLDIYRDVDPAEPYCGEWAVETRALPHFLQIHRQVRGEGLSPHDTRWARRAFYALCTHIDHQLRLVIGTLREEDLLQNTVIAFTSDHGDMLGNHGLWAKGMFYEDSARVPLILVGVEGDARVGHHRTDGRLAELRDIMPTLLDLAGLPIPATVDGISLVSTRRRELLYGEYREGEGATRMIHDGRYKLIYYPLGNRLQMFDLHEDPRELRDLAQSVAHRAVRERLIGALMGELYGGDEAWVANGQLVGLPDKPCERIPNRGLSGQRGLHWPPAPVRH